jgi:ubiquinone/menaquinone biosynthesis C-methylase UbiE
MGFDIRKLNNQLKRTFIESFSLKDAKVLDMGCGAGGDFHKWREALVGHLVAADPASGAIAQARQRRVHGPDSLEFVTGEINRVPVIKFDFIFWNFSLQYVFDSAGHLDHTINEMVRRSKPGTTVAGVLPDSQRIFMLPEDRFEDPQGNKVIKGPLTGDLGDKVAFFVRGAPYYRGGPIEEPLAWRDLFVTKMEAAGFVLDTWRPFSLQYTGLVTDLYSCFAFSFRGI